MIRDDLIRERNEAVRAAEALQVGMMLLHLAPSRLERELLTLVRFGLIDGVDVARLLNAYRGQS